MPGRRQPKQRLTIASVEPPLALAGVRDTWRVNLAGLDLPEGAIIRLQLAGSSDNLSDWTCPQIDNPAANEYASATCSGETQLLLRVPSEEAGTEVAIEMTLVGASLQSADTITVMLGDRSGGGEGSTPQTFSQAAKKFEVFIATPPSPGEELTFIRIKGEPRLDIVGGMMDRMRVLLPPTVPAGKQFAIAIKAEDVFGNLASIYQGELSLEISDEEICSGPDHVIFPGPGGVTSVNGFKALGRGVARVIATDEISDIRYVSNPLLITRYDQSQLFFGVVQNYAQCSSDTSSFENYCSSMRDNNRLDFGAISEGADSAAEQYEVKCAINQTSDVGKFTILRGIERPGSCSTGAFFTTDEQSEQRRGILIIHSPARIDGTCDWSNHDPTTPQLVEIYSAWGSSECSVFEGNPFPMRPSGTPISGFTDAPMDSGERAEGFVQHALIMGKRFGFIGGGDNCLGQAGDPVAMGAEPFRYSNGLTGVWAPELSRTAIFEAMSKRHTYATTGARMITLLRVSDAFMGDEVRLADQPELSKRREIEAFIAGEAKLAQVELIRNNEVVHRVRPDSSEFALEWTDKQALESAALTPSGGGERFVFYYLRVLQSDGHMAWTSPIWLLL